MVEKPLRGAARAIAIPGVEHTTSVAEEAERRVAADSAYKDARAHIGQLARAVYRQPDLAASAITARIMDDRAPVAATVQLIAHRPEAFGALRGGEGLLAFKGRAERKEALATARPLAAAAHRLAEVHQRAYDRISENTARERAREAIAVPALSQAAQNRIRELARIAHKSLPEAYARLREDKALAGEIDAFRNAFQKRFGSAAINKSSAREALQSLPREQRPAFAAAFALETRMRNVGYIVRDQAQVLARQHAIMQERGQGPTLTRGGKRRAQASVAPSWISRRQRDLNIATGSRLDAHRLGSGYLFHEKYSQARSA